jgi:glycosyltransferase involved in cell wall biosynthesis
MIKNITNNYSDISVVLISMNEQEAVNIVIKDIIKYAPKSEIILVDSSSDNTAEIAKKFLNVKLIRQFPPQGYGPAMTLALRSATKKCIITMDCDNTYPAQLIPLFAREIENGFDVVDGSRLGLKPLNMPFINFIANLFFARIASILFLKNLKDLHSGMRAYSNFFLGTLTWEEKGAALPVELLLRSIKNKCKLKIIYIDYKIRIGKSKMVPLTSAYWTLKRILKVRFK